MYAFGILLSALIGVSLGFFGGGGSILTVPLLVYVFGLDAKVAIASSLLIVGLASTSGAIQHARAGNVRPREGLTFGGASMLGAYLGGRASALFDGGVLLLLFAAMMSITASAMWRGRPNLSPGPSQNEGSPARLMAQGLGVGAFTGLVGAGGGFLIVPALALWAGLPMAAAVGTSLFVIVLKSLTGFSGYASHVTVEPRLILTVSGVAMLGSFLGTHLAKRIDPESLRRSFAAFVMAMACLILVREGALVATTVLPALPTTWPQVVFALLVLTVGITAGRASRRAERRRAELLLTQGAGI